MKIVSVKESIHFEDGSESTSINYDQQYVSKSKPSRLRWKSHDLARPVTVLPTGRVPVLGEYGGLGYAVEGHQWSSTAWGYGEKEVNRDPVTVLTACFDVFLFQQNYPTKYGMLKLTKCVEEWYWRFPSQTWRFEGFIVFIGESLGSRRSLWIFRSLVPIGPKKDVCTVSIDPMIRTKLQHDQFCGLVESLWSS